MALRRNTVLAELKLGLCGIGDEGVIPLTETLKSIRTLKVLDMLGNTVSPTAAKNIGEHCIGIFLQLQPFSFI